MRRSMFVLSFAVALTSGLGATLATSQHHWSILAATPTSPSDPMIAAAGDIACDLSQTHNSNLSHGGQICQQQATSDLLVGKNWAAILVLGDLQYENGALAKFQTSYHPTWGRVKAITRPAVGNHEYLTPGAAGYFNYFGAAAGPKGKGYYSYDLGSWHLIALNANCTQVSCGAGSAQEQWLKADLAQHQNLCTLAYWHQPRFSSAVHGNNPATADFWKDLYRAGAEIILNGHDHDYERFAPQTPTAIADPQKGIREFVVGSGGRSLYPFVKIQPNSQVRNDDTYGVLKLVLHPQSYEWKFISERGKTFTDSGQSSCHRG